MFDTCFTWLYRSLDRLAFLALVLNFGHISDVLARILRSVGSLRLLDLRFALLYTRWINNFIGERINY